MVFFLVKLRKKNVSWWRHTSMFLPLFFSLIYKALCENFNFQNREWNSYNEFHFGSSTSAKVVSKMPWNCFIVRSLNFVAKILRTICIIRRCIFDLFCECFASWVKSFKRNYILLFVVHCFVWGTYSYSINVSSVKRGGREMIWGKKIISCVCYIHVKISAKGRVLWMDETKKKNKVVLLAVFFSIFIGTLIIPFSKWNRFALLSKSFGWKCIWRHSADPFRRSTTSQ